MDGDERGARAYRPAEDVHAGHLLDGGEALDDGLLAAELEGADGEGGGDDQGHCHGQHRHEHDDRQLQRARPLLPVPEQQHEEDRDAAEVRVQGGFLGSVEVPGAREGPRVHDRIYDRAGCDVVGTRPYPRRPTRHMIFATVPRSFCTLPWCCEVSYF